MFETVPNLVFDESEKFARAYSLYAHEFSQYENRNHPCEILNLHYFPFIFFAD